MRCDRVRRWLAGRDRADAAGLPANELLAPLPLAALALLVLNDWLLKSTLVGSIGWLTGKLSDVAGLVLAPLVLTASADLLLQVAHTAGARVDPTLRRWKLVVACSMTGMVFMAVKLSPPAAAWVAHAWGYAWPGATIVADPTDLRTLPALLLAWWHGRNTIARVPYGRLAWIADQHRRGRATASPLRDVSACGAAPAHVAALEVALATWLRGGASRPVDEALAPLRDR
jgi:hypothetical protein